MVRFTQSIEIAAPPEVVWRVLADVRRWGEWSDSITSVRVVEGDTLAPGLRAEITQPRLPKATWTVTAVEDGRSFTWGTKNLGMRIQGSHVLTPLGNGTRADLGLEVSGIGSMLLRPFLAAGARRNLLMEANGLRRRSESIARA